MKFDHEITLDDTDNIPSILALYGVFKDDVLVYIGSSTCLGRRIKSHLFNLKFNDTHILKWNEYSESDVALLRKDEKAAIEKWQPPLNKNSIKATHKCYKLSPPSHRSIHFKPIVKSSLHKVTFDLIRDRISSSAGKTYTLDKIALATGLGYHWLDHFSRDNVVCSPAVYKVETLYTYLTGEPLQLKTTLSENS